jgi:hypothetical protein
VVHEINERSQCTLTRDVTFQLWVHGHIAYRSSGMFLDLKTAMSEIQIVGNKTILTVSVLEQCDQWTKA